MGIIFVLPEGESEEKARVYMAKVLLLLRIEGRENGERRELAFV